MKKLIDLTRSKPELYEQSPSSLWEDDYLSKGMLEAHLEKNDDGATRNLSFVKDSSQWISTLCPPSEYPKLLDLGCGPGIYAELFNKAGYLVTGIDISLRSINYAKQSAVEKQMDIHYEQGDYITMNLKEQYDVITLIYCDFGVLSSMHRKILLTKIYFALSPHGTFIFDVFTPLKYKDKKEFKNWTMHDTGFWHDAPHLLLQSFYRYNEDSTFLDQYIIIKEDKIDSYFVWEHTFSLYELKHCLLGAGFISIDFYKSLTGLSCTPYDETICIVSKK